MKRLLLALIVVAGFHTGTVLAQNNMIELTDDPSAVIGGTTTISAIWTDGGPVNNSVQFDVQFDAVAFTFNSCTVLAPYNTYVASCEIPVGETDLVRFLVFRIPSGPIASGTLFDLNFDVNGPAGSYQMTVENPSSGTQPVDTDPAMIEVSALPSPVLGSSPQNPGQTIDFGDHGTADPDAMASLAVSNVGNDEPLTGSCTISNTAGGVFSLSGDPVALNLDIADPAVDLDMTCDTSMLGTFNGQLTCTHNGSNNPSTWPLLCQVLPVPTYDSTPPDGGTIPLSGNEGNGAGTGSLIVDNDDGEMGSTLTGTCGLAGDPQISISGSAAFSVVQGATDSIDLSCSDADEGFFTSVLTCTANAPATNAGDFTYDVECTMGPPDPGSWGSVPAPGGDVDMTPGGPVLVGTDLTNAGTLEVFNDGEAGDEDIQYSCDITGGDVGVITQSPAPAVGTLAADGASDFINYSCNTDNPGNFSVTIQCSWFAPLEGANIENYTASCDVRDAFSQIEETPPTGTPQTAEVDAGDSHVFTFQFEEVIDEGESGFVQDCLLDNDNEFAITAPGGFPLEVPSGETREVEVTFTDPGDGDTFNDVLRCGLSYNPPIQGAEGVEEQVEWPLEVTVTGRNATFRVTKDFDDDNPAGVQVFMECNTGLPLTQNGLIHDADADDLSAGQFTHIDFVIRDFEPGTMDCEIFETVPAGYAQSYIADLGENGMAGDVFADGDGCFYEDVTGGGFICEITNELLPVDVIVEKEWIDDNPQFFGDETVEVTLRCDSEIIDGFVCLLVARGDNGLPYCREQFIDPDNPGEFQVYPHFDGTICNVTEEPLAAVDTDDSDCQGLELFPGQGASCTIVNTRLYEGIPTLSQYGLLVMALLMLGVGLVGFRRYV